MKRLVFLFSLVSLTACTTRQVEPTRASRRIIDSTFQQIVTRMQPEMDSVCRAYGDSLLVVAIDSMLRERQSEMQQLVQ